MLVTRTPQVGQTLRGHRILQLRGSGAFGSVYEAEDERGQKKGLKFLSCSDSVAGRQEIRAIQQLSKLQHLNLTPVEAVWSYEKYFVVVMPLADASLIDLYDAYQTEYGSGIDVKELCALLKQAAAALDFLNLRKHHLGSWPVGIQHCDIKPSNLLIFGDVVKVADFGLASPTSWPVQYHTRAGTPGYAAPEVFQGRLSAWTDQYSLAVTYCYLRGGRLPFHETAEETPCISYLRPAPDLSMLTAKEKPILARGLSAVPQERWPACCDMFAAIEEAIRK